VKKKNKIDYKNFIQKEYYFSKNNNYLKKSCSKILRNIQVNLDNNKNVFHSLSEKFLFNFKARDLKNFKRYNNIVVIGMGGSILGSEAIYSFLRRKIKKKFIFLNNINDESLQEIKKKIRINKTLFILISKSGNTVETLSNILTLKILNKSKKNIIVISDRNTSPLYLVSKKLNLFYVEHKKYIGGRYSVLSEVGMLPAYLMGVNIHKLRLNIRIHFKNKNSTFLKSSLMKMSNILKNKKLKNLIFLNYIPELNNFLYWSQQLIAESLGKKGKGFLPVVSSAPKDHHSLLQLYLDGPKDKLIYVFSLKNLQKSKVNSKIFGPKMKFINNRSLQKIKNAQKNALLKALKKNKIPFREFIISDLSEEVLGELFSFFMLETAIIGYLIGIDPFNQPAVEQVKIDTKRILS